jgi:hypothetical protein
VAGAYRLAHSAGRCFFAERVEPGLAPSEMSPWPAANRGVLNARPKSRETTQPIPPTRSARGPSVRFQAPACAVRAPQGGSSPWLRTHVDKNLRCSTHWLKAHSGSVAFYSGRIGSVEVASKPVSSFYAGVRAWGCRVEHITLTLPSASHSVCCKKTRSVVAQSRGSATGSQDLLAASNTAQMDRKCEACNSALHSARLLQ